MKQFLKITIRNLWRSKGFSAINLAGLAIGMAAAILILLWVRHELSFDRFHANTDRAYLLNSRDTYNGKPEVWDHTSSAIAPALKLSYPEVEEAVRYRVVYFLMTVGEKHLNVQGAFADSGFLSIFSFPLLKGNAAHSLYDPHSILITESLALKLFGNADPMGRMVRIDSADNFTVTGVLKNLPENTSKQLEYILPWSYLNKLGWDPESWVYTNTATYVLLKQGASQAAFEAKLKNINKEHIPSGDGSSREIIAQPLSRVHLYSKDENGQLVDGRIKMVRLFVLVAACILLIACINFMNLSTARSGKRAKEVGIRKVVGAAKSSLVIQFIGESVLMALFSFLLALGIVQCSLEGFNRIVGVTLRIDYTDYRFWLFSLSFTFFTGLLAGSYPAFYLSSSRPVKVLKGAFKNVHALVTPRKVLVVLQFTIAVILITCTIIVERQIRYARQRDTGYRKDNLVYTFTQGDMGRHYAAIKQELLSSGAAVAVTKAFSPITRVWGTEADLSWPGSTEADKRTIFLQFGADADFIQTTGTRLIQGRDIDTREYPSDSTSLILNEAAARAMRLKDPVGKMVKMQDGQVCHVVGVVKDFIVESPYDPILPMVIRGSFNRLGYGVVHFRLNPAHPAADNLARAEKIFKHYNPQYPFEYYFADEFYARKFIEEQQEGTLSGLFAALTVFISCLGLFGLAAYMAETRIKEIGVRKVLGASVASITSLLSGDFIKLVLVAIVIATPISWFTMNEWLGKFNYRVPVSWWMFATAGGMAVLIALLTVSYQAIKAAMANPARSLRSE